MKVKQRRKCYVWRKDIRDVWNKWIKTNPEDMPIKVIAKYLDCLFGIQKVFIDQNIPLTSAGITDYLIAAATISKLLKEEQQKTADLKARLTVMYATAVNLRAFGEALQGRVNAYAGAEAKHIKHVQMLAKQREQVLRGIEPTVSVLDSVADRNIPRYWLEPTPCAAIDSMELPKVPELPEALTQQQGTPILKSWVMGERD